MVEITEELRDRNGKLQHRKKYRYEKGSNKPLIIEDRNFKD